LWAPEAFDYGGGNGYMKAMSEGDEKSEGKSRRKGQK